MTTRAKKSAVVHWLSETDPARTFCGRPLGDKTYTHPDSKSVTCADCVMALDWTKNGRPWKHAKPCSYCQRRPHHASCARPRFCELCDHEKAAHTDQGCETCEGPLFCDAFRSPS